jgi:hypothetical protein
VAEAYSVVADCIAQAERTDTLLNQMATFVTVAHRSGFADRSMLQFTITARLESHRSASLRENPGPVVSAVQAFYASIIDEAVARGEIPVGTDVQSVVNMLLAMFLGMGFYAGFIVDQSDLPMIAQQLHSLMTNGLLGQQQNGRALTIAPPMPAAVGVDELPQTWDGLTG